jgi:hypothetical protein
MYVIIVIVIAAERTERDARTKFSVDILLIVSIPFAPPVKAPMTINTAEIIVAVLYFIILFETAVPNMFAASFAPNDHPKNIAGRRYKKIHTTPIKK